MVGYIYKIVNKVNNKFYIGSTCRKFNNRKRSHLFYLRDKSHYNNYLQNAWNKYGEENFEFLIIEEMIFSDNYDINCIHEYVSGRELYWVDILNPQYNLSRITKNGKLGRKLSISEIEKISKFHKGKVLSKETIDKIKSARSKQIITEEHKRKISESLKGKKQSEQTIMKRVENRRKIKEQKNIKEVSIGKLY